MLSQSITLDHFKVSHLTGVPPADLKQVLSSLEWISAKPGQAIHYDLMAAGKLDNPYAGVAAAKASSWVAQADWIYQTCFGLADSILQAPHVFINLECVDTYADVYVNGQLVGSCDNMFTPWRFDLSRAGLKADDNELLIHIKGHNRMVAHLADEAEELIGCDGRAPEWARERSLVRRYQRSYAEDFNYIGQAFWGIGLVRPLQVVALPRHYLAETQFFTRSIGQPAGHHALATVLVTADSDTAGKGFTVKAVLTTRSGTVASQGEAILADGKAEIGLTIDSASLWWPYGYGGQDLYDLNVSLCDTSGELHSQSSQVGIKTIELRQKTDDGRRDFRFIVNGKEIYARGSNIIPIDVLNAGGTPQQVEDLLKLAVNSNMNMMRLWGGGMPEPDWFYSLCDRYGILLWKDAHLHSHTYPDYLEAFNEEMIRETIVMIKQLRSHPCFAVFCCGNEQQEGWDAWNWRTTHDRFYGSKLIYEILPKVGAEYCPEIPCTSNSPFGQKLSQSPVDGETHTWGNFYNATEDPLFISETCWFNGTISRPKTLEKWMGIKADDYSGLRWQRKWQELTTHGLWNINQYSEYHKNASLREYAKGLEIEQMTADYMALFLLRTRSPSCTGILYWPFNKGGTMMNYGCIDYSGNPLMPYYNCVRLYKDQVVHIYRDCGDIRVHVTNDGEPFTARMNLRLFDTVNGEILHEASKDVCVKTGISQSLHSQDSWYGSISDRWRTAAHVELVSGGQVITEDFLLFCPLFELETSPAKIEIQARRSGEKEWTIGVACGQFIKLLELEVNARVMFSDNYFKLLPGVSRQLKLTVFGDRNGPLTLTAQALDHDQAVILNLE